MGAVEDPPPTQCQVCERWARFGFEPDPCLGELPGVAGACCGHNNPKEAYVSFNTGVVIRGFKVERRAQRVMRPGG